MGCACFNVCMSVNTSLFEYICIIAKCCCLMTESFYSVALLILVCVCIECVYFWKCA